jgi:hypothetical protein
MIANLDTLLRIVEIIAIIGGGGLVAFRIGRSTEKMQATVDMQAQFGRQHAREIAEIKEDIKQLGVVLTKLALQEQRLDMLDKRYEELRHGEGFVYPLKTYQGGPQ